MAASKPNDNSTENLVESYNNCCSPCSETGSIKESNTFCIDCGIYFCDQCLQDHNKFPALRSHKIVDKCDVVSQSEYGSTEADVPTERCSLHRGRVLDRFCQDHDEVCCEACVTIKHRSCTSLYRIEDVAKGITSSTEFKDVKDSLENVIKRIQLEQDKRSDNAASLDQKKRKILSDIDKYQDDLVNRIKEIAEASKQEVKQKHANLVKTTNSDAKELKTVLTVSQELSEKVKSDCQNEANIFTHIKHTKHIVNDVEKIVSEMSSNWHPKELDYCIEEAFEMVLKSFYHFAGDNRAYHTIDGRKINIKLKSDKETCDITGICILEDGAYVVSDFRNKSLKRLHENVAVMDDIKLAGSPISLCITGPQEVAVALREEKKVQFVTCGKTLSLGTSFSTELRCTGLYFGPQCNELYVSCGAKWRWDQKSKVNVYKMDGTLLRSYENDDSGSRLFSSPNNIVMASTTGVVYVTDRENGLIAFTKSGKKLWSYTDKKLKEPWGVYLLPGNQLLVTGSSSRNILQIGADGKEVCELVGTNERLNEPLAVTYDRKRSTIIVGCSADEIREFHLSRD